MAILELRTSKELESTITKSKILPLEKDLQTNEPLQFVTKEDYKRRKELFSKSLKEKALLATLKARVKAGI